MRTNILVAALVALALGVSACGGGSNPNLISPSPTPGGGTGPAWSIVAGMDFRPSPAISRGSPIDVMVLIEHKQAGISYAIDVQITRPDGSAEQRTIQGSSTMPGLAGSGFGYYPQLTGPYSVTARVKQSANGTAGPDGETSGAFAVQ